MGLNEETQKDLAAVYMCLYSYWFYPEEGLGNAWDAMNRLEIRGDHVAVRELATP